LPCRPALARIAGAAVVKSFQFSVFFLYFLSDVISRFKKYLSRQCFVAVRLATGIDRKSIQPVKNLASNALKVVVAVNEKC